MSKARSPRTTPRLFAMVRRSGKRKRGDERVPLARRVGMRPLAKDAVEMLDAVGPRVDEPLQQNLGPPPVPFFCLANRTTTERYRNLVNQTQQTNAINVIAHQVHGERALLAVFRVAALALLHEYLTLTHGVTHGG